MAQQKADFSDIYIQPDPVASTGRFSALDYTIPERGREVFAVVLDELRETRPSPMVLDLCCSYGINAAVLNHGLTFGEIEATTPRPRASTGGDDRATGPGTAPAGCPTPSPWSVSMSQPAIDYAVEAGLLVDGVVADLERDALTIEDGARLAGSTWSPSPVASAT